MRCPPKEEDRVWNPYREEDEEWIEDSRDAWWARAARTWVTNFLPHGDLCWPSHRVCRAPSPPPGPTKLCVSIERGPHCARTASRP